MSKRNRNSDYNNEKIDIIENESPVTIEKSLISEEKEYLENTIEEPKNEDLSVVGIVTNCIKLNIRNEPQSGALIICDVPALTELLISMDASTDEWYSICTESGIEGFVMKKFVAVRQ